MYLYLGVGAGRELHALNRLAAAPKMLLPMCSCLIRIDSTMPQ